MSNLNTVNSARLWLIISYFAVLTFAAIAHASSSSLPDLYEASLEDLRAGLDAGHFTSVDLIKAYFTRIEEVNLKGPELRAVIETNPSALREAASLDAERRTSGSRGILHGIPVLVKDNVATVASEGMNTTAGSYALLGSVVPDDASVIKRLRKAGAIILGKANLSEWAHFRGLQASGWSGRGGQGTNPYFPKGDPCGSSSGSAVAAAIGLTAVALGTETDGSITCPSGYNNIVGIKPTVGLTSRAGVIPISEHQDTVGPLARSIADAVALLSVISGPDPNDNFTLSQPHPVPDFKRALNPNALKGKRIGVPRKVLLNDSITGNDPSIMPVFEEALKTLRTLGATIVDPADVPSAEQLLTTALDAENTVLFVDFKIQLNAWFANLKANPSGVRTLEQLIEFNDAHPNLEEPVGYQNDSNLVFLLSQNTTGRNQTYFDALKTSTRLGGRDGIDAALKIHSLDALVLPSPGLTPHLAALSGYPIVTVPLGFYPDNVTAVSTGPGTFYPAPGIPFGLSFIAGKFRDYQLIGFAYAYEQATHTRLQKKAYPEAIPKTQLKDLVNK